MSIKKEKLFLILAVAITLGLSIYLIRSILAPFIFSLVVAYFLHPLVDKMCRKNVSRFRAALLIILLFFALLFCVLSLSLPIIYDQLEAFILALPQYFQTVANEIYPKFAASLNKVGIVVNGDFAQVIDDAKINAKILEFIKNFLLNVVSSSVAFVNILSLIFITPILIFYLLKDWNLLVEKIKSYLPSKVAASATQIMHEIDAAMAGYIRGQIAVCLVLGLIYSVLLSLAGLNFGFLIGIITGILTFIPYVGALSGFMVAIVIAIFQWGLSFVDLITISAIFIFCQILESNFLTPKLVGENIGLHPVWIVFGLFVFGVLFGFMGVLFATPLTAICGVLIKHLALEYKKHIS